MNKNKQKPSPQFRHPEGALHLHHIFPTIQGEGPFAGTPAIFVRLFGCNLQCPFCDTDYTSKRETVSPADLFLQIWKIIPVRWWGNREGPLVVISGGEPFRQNIGPLASLLIAKGLRVQIETNGSLFLEKFPFDKVTIVCSPKTSKISPELAAKVNAFKYVVEAGKIDPRDGLPFSALGGSENGIAKPPPGSPAEVYIQPLDEEDETKNRAHLEAALQSCRTFGYRLCIQTHKLCGLE